MGSPKAWSRITATFPWITIDWDEAKKKSVTRSTHNLHELERFPSCITTGSSSYDFGPAEDQYDRHRSGNPVVDDALYDLFSVRGARHGEHRGELRERVFDRLADDLKQSATEWTERLKLEKYFDAFEDVAKRGKAAGYGKKVDSNEVPPVCGAHCCSPTSMEAEDWMHADFKPASQADRTAAAAMVQPLRDAHGKWRFFGDLFPDIEALDESTVVIFIRHFWCGVCHNYMMHSIRQLDNNKIEQAGIKVVIITHGSWKNISNYASFFQCPFPIHVDESRNLYRLFSFGDGTYYEPRRGRHEVYHKGCRHMTRLIGFIRGLLHFRERPGNVAQLGGEVILHAGYRIPWVHRMDRRNDYYDAPSLLRLAGCPDPVKNKTRHYRVLNPLPELERPAQWRRYKQRLEREAERMTMRTPELTPDSAIPTSPASTEMSPTELHTPQPGSPEVLTAERLGDKVTLPSPVASLPSRSSSLRVTLGKISGARSYFAASAQNSVPDADGIGIAH